MGRMRSLRVTLSLAPLFTLACAPPPPPAPPPVEIAAPAPTASAAPAPPLDPTIVSVAAVRAPARFALDGDIVEWGSLLPPIPEPPKQPPKEPPPPDPNPRDAASHVAIAVGAERVLIAAELADVAQGGLWLGIGHSAPDVPPIGDWQRGGGVREFDCETNIGTGEPNPPETVAACRALLQQHADFTAAHQARFRRLFKIDREGVRAAKDDGTLSAIDGAQAMFKPGAKGATVEVALPLKSLPPVSEAPLASVRFVARAATTPKPPAVEAAKWVWLDLPDPVGFEPFAELRAKAFEAMRSRVMLGPLGLSYHPAEPLRVQYVSYDRPGYDTSHVAASDAPLYRKEATIGDVEVGRVSVYNEFIGILRQGKLVELVDLPGRVMGVLERDGEIHVVSFTHYTATDTWTDSAHWSAMAIKPDGSVREEIVEQESANRPWNEVSEFHDKKLTSFGVRGWSQYTASGQPEGFELTWRWNPATKTYAGKSRKIPVRKKAKKKR